MNLNPIEALFDIGRVAIEKIWPDPTKRAQEIRKLEEMKQKGDIARLTAHVELMLAQVKVNLEEAKHKSIFVAGWRPFIGWVGGLSLAYAGLIYPLLTWVWKFSGIDGDPPPFVESATLGAIVTGMLGIGSMRSYDKTKGVQTDKIGR
jgi:hypothetical protein